MSVVPALAEVAASPQVVLVLWCPLALVALWRATRGLRARLAPRERYAVAVIASLVPTAALFVPYLPSSALREALPWRAPIAWGITGGFGPATLDALPHPLWVVVMLLWALPFVSLTVSAAVAAFQLWSGRRRARAMAVERRDGLDVVDAAGFTAATVGLIRPRVLVGRTVLGTVHAGAVLAHERCHARSRHPLWTALATTALRAWWWVPGRGSVLAEVRAAAELHADAAARADCGTPAVAAALLARTPAGRAAVPTGAPSFALAFADDALERLVERAGALLVPARRAGTVERAGAVGAALALALTVIVLL